MVSVCRMSVYLCYLVRSHAIASLIEFLWFSFINFGTVAGQWCKIRDCPAIFRTVGNYAVCGYIPTVLLTRMQFLESLNARSVHLNLFFFMILDCFFYHYI